MKKYKKLLINIMVIFIILFNSVLIFSNLNGNDSPASVKIAPDVSNLNLFPT